MSERKPSTLIKDILNSIERIINYTSDISFDAFNSNFMVVEACLYNIQIIGEAISKLPDDVKKENAIPWALIKGMRNRLIHEYFGTDTEIVWNVIKHELPQTVEIFKRIQERLITENR